MMNKENKLRMVELLKQKLNDNRTSNPSTSTKRPPIDSGRPIKQPLDPMPPIDSGRPIKQPLDPMPPIDSGRPIKQRPNSVAPIPKRRSLMSSKE